MQLVSEVLGRLGGLKNGALKPRVWLIPGRMKLLSLKIHMERFTDYYVSDLLKNNLQVGYGEKGM